MHPKLTHPPHQTFPRSGVSAERRCLGCTKLAALCRDAATSRLTRLVMLALLPLACASTAQTSRTISTVLREPLPPEELSLSESAAEFAFTGPTFTYRVQKATGAISGIRVVREGQEVIMASGPPTSRLTSTGSPPN